MTILNLSEIGDESDSEDEPKKMMRVPSIWTVPEREFLVEYIEGYIAGGEDDRILLLETKVIPEFLRKFWEADLREEQELVISKTIRAWFAKKAPIPKKRILSPRKSKWSPREQQVLTRYIEQFRVGGKSRRKLLVATQVMPEFIRTFRPKGILLEDKKHLKKTIIDWLVIEARRRDESLCDPEEGLNMYNPPVASPSRAQSIKRSSSELESSPGPRNSYHIMKKRKIDAESTSDEPQTHVDSLSRSAIIKKQRRSKVQSESPTSTDVPLSSSPPLLRLYKRKHDELEDNPVEAASPSPAAQYIRQLRLRRRTVPMVRYPTTESSMPSHTASDSEDAPATPNGYIPVIASLSSSARTTPYNDDDDASHSEVSPATRSRPIAAIGSLSSLARTTPCDDDASDSEPTAPVVSSPLTSLSSSDDTSHSEGATGAPPRPNIAIPSLISSHTSTPTVPHSPFLAKEERTTPAIEKFPQRVQRAQPSYPQNRHPITAYPADAPVAGPSKSSTPNPLPRSSKPIWNPVTAELLLKFLAAQKASVAVPFIGGAIIHEAPVATTTNAVASKPFLPEAPGQNSVQHRSRPSSASQMPNQPVHMAVQQSLPNPTLRPSDATSDPTQAPVFTSAATRTKFSSGIQANARPPIGPTPTPSLPAYSGESGSQAVSPASIEFTVSPQAFAAPAMAIPAVVEITSGAVSNINAVSDASSSTNAAVADTSSADTSPAKRHISRGLTSQGQEQLGLKLVEGKNIVSRLEQLATSIEAQSQQSATQLAQAQSFVSQKVATAVERMEHLCEHQDLMQAKHADLEDKVEKLLKSGIPPDNQQESRLMQMMKHLVQRVDNIARRVEVTSKHVETVARDVSSIKGILGVDDDVFKEVDGRPQQKKSRLHDVVEVIDVDVIDGPEVSGSGSTTANTSTRTQKKEQKSMFALVESIQMDVSDWMERLRDPCAAASDEIQIEEMDEEAEDEVQDMRMDVIHVEEVEIEEVSLREDDDVALAISLDRRHSGAIDGKPRLIAETGVIESVVGRFRMAIGGRTTITFYLVKLRSCGYSEASWESLDKFKQLPNSDILLEVFQRLAEAEGLDVHSSNDEYVYLREAINAGWKPDGTFIRPE